LALIETSRLHAGTASETLALDIPRSPQRASLWLLPDRPSRPGNDDGHRVEAINLGTLNARDHHSLVDHIDLSTVDTGNHRCLVDHIDLCAIDSCDGCGLIDNIDV
jgi:hypothetical protein